jgi:hypothetical protein
MKTQIKAMGRSSEPPASAGVILTLNNTAMRCSKSLARTLQLYSTSFMKIMIYSKRLKRKMTRK